MDYWQRRGSFYWLAKHLGLIATKDLITSVILLDVPSHTRKALPRAGSWSSYGNWADCIIATNEGLPGSFIATV